MSTQEFVRVTAERASRSLSLPPDIVARATQRLAAAALVYAMAYLLSWLPGMLVPDPVIPEGHYRGVHLLVGPAFILFSLAVFLLVRRSRLDPQLVLDLGLFYEVIGALGIEIWLLLTWDVVSLVMGDPRPLGISWVCVWIVVFPLIVPTTPGKAFLAATASASMRPLLLLILAASGRSMPSVAGLIEWIWPNFICVAIAVATARIVYGMQSEVSEARRMGSYRLVERLGEGGMGEVWRAEHQLLARPAAVKLIRPEALGAEQTVGEANVVRRFEREARATAALSSPHTIQLHDFGVARDGTFYYVMELLHGLDLDEFVKRFGPMPASRAVHVLQQACDSLGEAHECGLVHRDVKPANVYLCRVGRTHDFVKVLDFGLVKATDDGQATRLTAQDVAAGTPAFMAPEVAMGEAEIDGRADVYALGCVAYWLLTGVFVFEARNPMQLAFAHANTNPLPPSKRGEVTIPAALEQVIMACLAKDPGERPQSTDALGTALAGALPDGSWTERQAAEWWRRHLPALA